jgi:cell division protein FtsN
LGIDLDRMRTVVQRAPGAPRGLVAAVGLGVAFGLGAVIGGGGDARALGREDVAAQIAARDGRVEDQLVVATKRSEALAETRAKLKLTYGAELAKPDAPEPPRKLAKAAPAASAATTQAKAEEVADPIEAPPAPVVDAPPPAPPPAAAPDAGAPDEDDDEDVAKRSGDDLKAAIARVVADVPASDAQFTLQVAAAPTQAGADDVVKKLNSAGHSARVVEGQVGGKPVFRVRVGAFTDRAQADSYKNKLAMPAFIVRE